jgi:hypothetical protein
MAEGSGSRREYLKRGRLKSSDTLRIDRVNPDHDSKALDKILFLCGLT